MMNLEGLPAFCAACNGATIDYKWSANNQCFSVGMKLFAMFLLGRDGVPASLTLKLDPARFLELTDLPGVRPAPYLGRYHWVEIAADNVLTVGQLQALLQQSYAMVVARLPRRLRPGPSASPGI